ncbi:MAG: YceD family protein [Candidatus Margulisiibacteriota bacterium]
MQIDLSELLRKVGNEAQITKEERLNFPEDNLILKEPVKIDIHLTNSGTKVLLKGTFKTTAELECARCLKKFDAPLTAEVEEEYAKNQPEPKKLKEKEIELTEEDFIYPISKDNTLNLEEIIRQNLILTLPIKPLCSPECKGLP